jgi:hypothetical protein
VDDLTFLIVSSHVKVRLARLELHPDLWRFGMTPKFKGLGPALAKLTHDLDLQAAPLMADIESLSSEAPGLIKQAAQRVAETKQAVADIKDFVNSLTGSNGGPTLADSSATSDASAAAPVTPVPAAPSPVAAQAAAPEKVDVHGVSQG